MVDGKRIQDDGVRLLEEFSEKLKGVPETSETHYVLDMKNVWRPDGEPVKTEGFRDHIQRLAPRFDRGFVVTEKGA